MGSLIWQDSYDVGVDSFNEQHKVLFSIHNEAVTLTNSGCSQEEIFPVLNKLIHYIQFHFQEEEKLMEKYDYPEINAHKAQHEELVVKLFSLTEEMSKENFDTNQLISFLKNWVSSHILQKDMQYKPFFHKVINQASSSSA